MKGGFFVVLLFAGCFLATSSTALPSSKSSMIPDTLIVTQQVDSNRKVIYTVIIDTLSIDTIEIFKNRLPAGYSYTADVLIDYAKKYIGTPYRYSARGPSAFDCSGFTRFVFNEFDYKLENSSRNQYRSLKWTKVERDSLMVGDLVFFGGRSASSSVGHVGIVASVEEGGDFSFIHASTSLGVCVTDFSTSPYYIRRYIGASRVLPEYDTMYVEGVNVEQLTRRVELVETRGEADEQQKKLLEAISSQSSEQNEELRAMLNENNNETLQPIEHVLASEIKEEKTQDIQQSENRDEYYLVVRGDTLYGIARKHGIPLTELCKLNNISNANTYKLFPGNRLRVK